MDFSLAQVSRQPPPSLPGGYTVGEQIYYTGEGKTFGDGDRVEHGKQGEVVGPAIAESHKGKGVAVRFPGNKGAIICHRDHLRRGRRRAQPTRSSPPPICSSSQPTHGVWRVGVQVSRQPPSAAKEEAV